MLTNIPHCGRRPRCPDFNLMALWLLQESLDISSERRFFDYLQQHFPHLARSIGLRFFNSSIPKQAALLITYAILLPFDFNYSHALLKIFRYIFLSNMEDLFIISSYNLVHQFRKRRMLDFRQYEFIAFYKYR